jgi:copper chaperone NosL
VAPVRPTRLGRHWRGFIASWVALTLLTACGSGEPHPIAYGTAECAYCRMRIGDPRFGAVVVTKTGKAVEFDSIECAAAYYATLGDDPTVRGAWVSDFARPGTLVPVAEARFGLLQGPMSPMGRGLFAVAASTPADDGSGPTASMDWTDVVALAQLELAPPDRTPPAPLPTGADGARAR